jgi:hypothetical protein
MNAIDNNIIEIVVPYADCIPYPYYLYPDNPDNRKEHHEYQPDELFPAHDAKLTYRHKIHTSFNFSLTLINLILTVS